MRCKVNNNAVILVVIAITIFSSSSIGCELLRLFGNVTVLRAPLESLFHRLLVTNHAQTRMEVLKITKQVLSQCAQVQPKSKLSI